MTFETADDVLEHFGVKGMKWGVRNKRDSDGKSGGKDEKKTSKKKRAAQVAVVVGVIVAGAIIANRAGVRTNSLRYSPGSGQVARQLARERQVLGGMAARESRVLAGMASRERRTVEAGAARTAETLRRIGNERFSAIPMPPVRTSAPSRPRFRSSAGDAAALRSSIANSVREANAQLRANDNRLNIPFNERSYLTEWD